MSIYATDQLDAAAMLSEAGQSVTVTSKGAGSYSPATGAVSTSPSSQTAKAVIFDFSAGLRAVNGNIPSTDRLCILSALTTAGAALTAPKVNDTVTDVNGATYNVQAVSPLAPDGLPIIYELTLRGHQ